MTPAVSIQNLKFRWPGTSRFGLSIPSLELAPGEMVFLKGPSGTGKSTLLNLVSGVLLPQSGDIHVLGRSLTKMSHPERDQLRGGHMGFVFQMFNLIPYLSVLENVTLPVRFSDQKASRLKADGQGATSEAIRLLSHLGLGDTHILHKSATQLSVGQMQRVAAARALMGRPEILIADEPTSALDADNREEFLKLLVQECKTFGMTLLFVSHDSSLAGSFDRILSLGDLSDVYR